MKKKIALLLATALLACTTGCGDKDTSGGDSVSTTEATEAWTMADASLGLPTLDLGYTTEEMIVRSIVSEGNTARLAKAMQKAENGEIVTIGTIGGSITQGSSASSSTDAYANQALRWWVKAFPNGQFDFVNAGIGATGSYIGVHRAETDLLSHNPDVVIVEFSVNDTDAELNLQTYDSLVRKILNADNAPAVILLFTTQEDGTSLQDTHMQVGAAYDLPMISYKNAILPEIEAGTFKWTDISPDNIHPNSIGHGIISELLWSYFNSVYAKLSTIDTSDTAFTAEALTADKYADAMLYDSSNLTPTASTGFEPSSASYQFPNDWSTTTKDSSISFEVTGKNIGLLYYETIDGLSGQYSVYVDGHLSKIIDADSSGGWGNYAEAIEVYTSDTAGTHTVEIKMLEDTTLANFSVLGLLVS